MTTTNDKPKLMRGFALLGYAERSKIASMGGRAAHEAGTAHTFTPEEARAAGKRSHASRKKNNSAAP